MYVCTQQVYMYCAYPLICPLPIRWCTSIEWVCSRLLDMFGQWRCQRSLQTMSLSSSAQELSLEMAFRGERERERERERETSLFPLAITKKLNTRNPSLSNMQAEGTVLTCQYTQLHIHMSSNRLQCIYMYHMKQDTIMEVGGSL